MKWPLVSLHGPLFEAALWGHFVKCPFVSLQGFASAVMGKDANDMTASASAMFFIRHLPRFNPVDYNRPCFLGKVGRLSAIGLSDRSLEWREWGGEETSRFAVEACRFIA